MGLDPNDNNLWYILLGQVHQKDYELSSHWHTLSIIDHTLFFFSRPATACIWCSPRNKINNKR
jgi:hypothetical protein